MFLDSCRPAIDSGLSVSRIGSNAQCKLMKVYSVGIKNLLTNYRNVSLNLIFFQDHLLISPLETSLLLLLLLRMDYWFNSLFQIHRLLFILSIDVYVYYILFISKTFYSVLILQLLKTSISSVFVQLNSFYFSLIVLVLKSS